MAKRRTTIKLLFFLMLRFRLLKENLSKLSSLQLDHNTTLGAKAVQNEKFSRHFTLRKKKCRKENRY